MWRDYTNVPTNTMGLLKGENQTIGSSRSSGLNSQEVDVQVIVTEKETDIEKWQYRKPAYGAVALVMALTAFAVLFPMIITSDTLGLRESIFHVKRKPCFDRCKITLVESIPENLTFPRGSPVHISTYTAWKTLLAKANHTIDIASFYWTLRGQDLHVVDPSTWQGEDIFNRILEAGTKRKIKIRIAQNSSQYDADTQEFIKQGAAEVRNFNMSRLLGSGILHTKFWIVDKKHFYIGSANMDFRSLTQVKELGALVTDCSCLANDLQKVFDAYWLLAQSNASIPSRWPHKYNTVYNWEYPFSMTLNHTQANVFLSSSPPPLCPSGRTNDIDAIINVINNATKFVHVAVMDYFPLFIYTKHLEFWPRIDDALRKAAIDRGVQVRLLASHWNHTRAYLPKFLQSLASVSQLDKHAGVIQVKLFVVPTYTEAQSKIPFARVNHNKYMVTDSVAYVGTSNWSADYFNATAGVGLIIRQNITEKGTFQKQLAAVFERDWNSPYAKDVSEF